MSLDGIVEGLKDAMDISFVRYHEQLETFANQGLSTCDTVLLGRATYEMMHTGQQCWIILKPLLMREIRRIGLSKYKKLSALEA